MLVVVVVSATESSPLSTGPGGLAISNVRHTSEPVCPSPESPVIPQVYMFRLIISVIVLGIVLTTLKSSTKEIGRQLVFKNTFIGTA